MDVGKIGKKVVEVVVPLTIGLVIDSFVGITEKLNSFLQKR